MSSQRQAALPDFNSLDFNRGGIKAPWVVSKMESHGHPLDGRGLFAGLVDHFKLAS